MQNLDLEALTKVWTAAAQPLRLSVGYEVSLVAVEQQARSTSGPPVRTARTVVQRVARHASGFAAPSRLGADGEILVRTTGVVPDTAYLLQAKRRTRWPRPTAAGRW